MRLRVTLLKALLGLAAYSGGGTTLIAMAEVAVPNASETAPPIRVPVPKPALNPNRAKPDVKSPAGKPAAAVDRTLPHLSHSTIGTISPIDDETWKMMQGRSWRPNAGCPERRELSLLRVPYIDFFGDEQLGELVVAKSVAADVLSVFAALRKHEFRFASIRLIDRFDGNDKASMAANNTSGFNCRLVTLGVGLSEHAKGTAIDINPIQNPYVVAGRASPPAGQQYAAARLRSPKATGLIRAGDVVVAEFRRIGWSWGGGWSKKKDYQHFSKSGR